MTIVEIAAEMRLLSESIDRALHSLTESVRTLAQAENDYRKGAAAAWVQVRVTDGMTAADKESEVKSRTADMRMARDIADGMRQTSLEALRARRTQMSALQSLMNATRAEADVLTYGQGHTA